MDQNNLVFQTLWIEPAAASPPLSEAILMTAAYADVFDYPLTLPEIHRYLVGQAASRERVQAVLDQGDLLSRSGAYYTLPGREEIVPLRAAREARSARLWPLALRFGRIIAGIPFVRMLAVTGSLAMNNVDAEADVDYLIVTTPGRLWTVRAAVLAVARLAALWKVQVCPNYLVSERALVFPDQTLYTAHELAQMVPLFGLDVYAHILRLNAWREGYLPNAAGMPDTAGGMRALPELTRFHSRLERLIPAVIGDHIERWEMDRKIARLSREQSFSSESAFSADFCKGHDRRHAQRTEQQLQGRLERAARFAETPK